MSLKKNKIEFILKGKRHCININEESLSPTTTVLEYLRSKPEFKGVKEGCAEGDCGACTLVLGSLTKDGTIKYKSFDSCLVFLPMLHGKELITVECIGSSDKLHHVQKEMVECDGSQCGYCTPGFIMSMYYLYQKGKPATREEIDDALTGNLCRCTGYRSIVDAAIKSCGQPIRNGSEAAKIKVAALLNEIQDEGIEIKTPKQYYIQPKNLNVLLDVLADKPDCLIVSGATDIGLKVTKAKENLPKILDISSVQELKSVKLEHHGIWYGSGVNLEDIRVHCQSYLPALHNMLNVFGSRQIRYMGTIGGNIASASPIGDVPPVIMAYDAIIKLVSKEGVREVKAREFVTGYRETLLKPGEIIHSIFIPFPHKKNKIRSYKISKRKDLDISTVSGGFQVLIDKDKIEDIALVYGGVAAMTKRAEKAESYLKGKEWSRENVEHAMVLVDEDFTPISDARSGAQARKIMARNLLMKFWNDTKDE